jgi:hypothetical protein
LGSKGSPNSAGWTLVKVWIWAWTWAAIFAGALGAGGVGAKWHWHEGPFRIRLEVAVKAPHTEQSSTGDPGVHVRLGNSIEAPQ